MLAFALALLALTSAADVITTRRGLATGRLEEINPLMRPLLTRGGAWPWLAKGAGVGLSISGILEINARNPGLAVAFAGAAALLTAFIAYRNHVLTARFANKTDWIDPPAPPSAPIDAPRVIVDTDADLEELQDAAAAHDEDLSHLLDCHEARLLCGCA